MRKEILSSVCALSLLFGAGSALAGSYGDVEQPEEMPASPPPAQIVEAETEIDYAAPGAYIGAGGIYAVELFSQGDRNSTPVAYNKDGGDVDNSGGFYVEAGYRILPNLAVDARYSYYNEFDADPGQIDAWSLTANAKGYILTGRFQPYVLVGLGYLAGNGSGGNQAAVANPGDGFMMRFGGGFDGYITEHLSMGPEIAYVMPFGGASNLDMIEISAGLKYKF